MTIVVEKRPPREDILPPLPPWLGPKKRGGKGVAIIPSIRHAHLLTRTQHDNCWTLHYSWMERIHLDTGLVDGPVHVNTRIYHQWLDTYEPEHNIPPHIQFGGAIVAGEADITFHAKWVAYAQKAFC